MQQFPPELHNGIPVFVVAIKLLIVVALVGGIAFVIAAIARRRGTSAGTILAGLASASALLFLMVGVGFVSVRAVHIPPPTVVYASSASPIPPTVAVAPAFPPGSGMTPVREPERVSPGDAILEEKRRHAEKRPATDVAAKDTPAWVRQGTVKEGDRTLLVVSGQQYADANAAFQDAIRQAADLVRQDFISAFRPFGQWVLRPDQADAIAVRERYTEEIRRTAGENAFTVYRTHLRVELSPAVRDALEPIWRKQITTGRSAITAGLFVLLTAAAAVFAGYFRLDDRTAGRYRWRLRFGSVAAILLAGGTVLAGLTFIPIASDARPVLPPPVPERIEAPASHGATTPPQIVSSGETPDA